ncbi:DUF1232 domain-containing protein [Clostridium cylindrosporum]|uniref:Transcriptional regulator n=1 Tax=Clostridium cylindrosporum DSM 605 TaxID=1121307 RepID=A0A0J8DG35_CLOCY|nr:DUF1232 domain-containing protein [Clostridium cylindrosporum]KMT23199.1 transcriptional regulator [Clostridium cylindrosporum DSM 605]
MEDRNDNGKLGTILKSLLEENSLSIGKLSIKTEIDKATISRIINNKQKANMNHLDRFSKALNISLEVLLQAAGYNLSKVDNKICMRDKGTYCFDENYDELESLLKMIELPENSELKKTISFELKKYEEYAKTTEGKNIIYENFEKKLTNLNGSGAFLEKLTHMYQRFCSKNTSLREIILTGSALLYFITSTDVLPDFIVPIGFLDDFIAMKIVLNSMDSIEDK